MASRWIDQPAHKDLKGDALVKALDGQDWDASVKSLVPFPTVLKTMSDQLDWTQKLGDAFLAQQADVLAAVQALRGRAQAAGTLQTNTQQTVTQEASAIVIQPTQPYTVYVPAYNPTVAYGAWPYPSYPPPYYPPPAGYYVGSALATGLAFGAGIAITGALWGWGSPNWSGGNVNVNVNRFNSINANSVNANRISNRAASSSTWQHNAGPPARRRLYEFSGQAAVPAELRRQCGVAGGVPRSRDRRGAGPGAGRATSGWRRQPGERSRPNAGVGQCLRAEQPGGGAGNATGQARERPATERGRRWQAIAERPAAEGGGGAPAFKGVGNGGGDPRSVGAGSRQPRRHVSVPGGGGGGRRGPVAVAVEGVAVAAEEGVADASTIFCGWLGAILLALPLLAAAPAADAPQQFASPDAAVDALVAAVRPTTWRRLRIVRRSRTARCERRRPGRQRRAAREIHRGL